MAIPRTTWTNDSGTPSAPVGDGTSLTNAGALQPIYDAIESWDVDSYSPAWTGSGSNPAIVNGTIVGRYVAIGDLVHFRVVITMGSSTTYGTGNYSVSLPLTGVVGSGNVKIVGSDGGTVYAGFGFVATTTTVALLSDDTNGTTGAASTWTPTAPFTFGTGDVIYIAGSYLRA